MKRTLTFIIAVLFVASAAAFAADSPVSTKSTDGEKRITLQLKATPLPQVLAMLFKEWHANYVLEPMPNAPTVTLVIEDVSFQDALQAVARASGVWVRRSNGVYYIGPTPANPFPQMQADLMTEINDLKAQLAEKRKTIPEDSSEIRSLKATIENREQTLAGMSPTPSAPAAPPPESPKTGEHAVSSEVFELRYLRPVEIAPMISSVLGVKSVTSVGTSKIIVTGPQYAIADARELIAKLDDKSAFPTPVRVVVRMQVTAEGGKPAEMHTDGVGTMDSPIRLLLKVDRSAKPGAPVASKASVPMQMFQSTITPSYVDGGISLKGDVAFQYQIGQQLVSKESDVLAVAQPGQSVLLTSGSSTVGGETAEFEVSVTVLIDEGPTSAAKKPSAKPTK